MRRFGSLYQRLDASTATGDKVAALRDYFARAPAADAAWAVYFLAGGKPRQVVPTALLRETACGLAGIDPWLFEECYQAVGDLAETIALVLPQAPSAAAPVPVDLATHAAHDPTTEAGADAGLAHWIEQRLLPLRGLAPQEQAARLAAALGALDAPGRFLLVKLIGGGFRVGVSKLLVQRALAEVAGLDAKVVAQRMMGYAEARAAPSAERFAALVAAPGQGTPGADGAQGVSGQPYPFFLAHALQAQAAVPEALQASLGPVEDWLIEWKYDGIRAQLVKRAGQCWIWSRGEELVTERFPEVEQGARRLPDGTVLDGELLAWRAGAAGPTSFHLLQQRIGRKTLTKKVLADAPVVFVAYDLLESDGVDRRREVQAQRRWRLEALRGSEPGGAGQPGEAGRVGEPVDVDQAAEAWRAAPAGQALSVSPALAARSWGEAAALRASARERGVEGLMLKHREARYGSGRTKSEGTWWKWKIDPLSVDAVLVYAQAGHGRRASVYTDYTFALWSRRPRDAAEAQAVVEAIARGEPAPRQTEALQLLPFAKAYSGLTDDEFKAVDREIRARTLTKFGPVRSVRPTMVFEIGFEGINASPRHKSGVAVRFPRMLRMRADKPVHEADSMEALRGLLRA